MNLIEQIKSMNERDRLLILILLSIVVPEDVEMAIEAIKEQQVEKTV